MKPKIILMGGGGHCKSCIDVIELAGLYEIVGIVDVNDKLGTRVLGYEIFATDDELDALCRDFRYFHISVGQMLSSSIRANIYMKLKSFGAELPLIISPRAHVSRHSSIGEGSIVMHNATVNAGAQIGICCILNTGCIVEHDVSVGGFCHVSTGAIINGGVTVENGCFIGSSATIREGIKIANDVVLGLGAAVVSDCAQSETFVGNPAKKMCL